MELGAIYGGAQQPTTQAVSQPASTDRDTTAAAKQPAPAPVNHQAVSISWVGMILALVLLRVVYEVAD